MTANVINPEKRYTYSEFLEAFAPRDILSRLKDYLCKRFDLTHPRQFRFDPEQEDRRLGLVEVAKSGWHDLAGFRQMVHDFYVGERYTVTSDQDNILHLTDSRGEQFWLLVTETDAGFTVTVRAKRVLR